MTNFPSLPEGVHLADLYGLFPKGLRPLLELNDVFLRGESEFTIAERELISAYVSICNSCDFCFASHAVAARGPGLVSLDWVLGLERGPAR